MVKYTKKSVQKGSGIRSIKSRIKRLFKRKEKAPINSISRREAESIARRKEKSIARRKAESISRREVASTIVNKTEKKSGVLDKIFSSLCKKKSQRYLKDPEKEGSGILYKGCNYIYPHLFNQLNQHKIENTISRNILSKKAAYNKGMKNHNTALNTLKNIIDQSIYKTTDLTKEQIDDLLSKINPVLSAKIESIRKYTGSKTYNKQDKLYVYKEINTLIRKMDSIIDNKKYDIKTELIDEYNFLKKSFKGLITKNDHTKEYDAYFTNSSPFFSPSAHPKNSSPEKMTITKAYSILVDVNIGINHVVKRLEPYFENGQLIKRPNDNMNEYFKEHIQNFKDKILEIGPVLLDSIYQDKIIQLKEDVLFLCSKIKEIIPDIEC